MRLSKALAIVFLFFGAAFAGNLRNQEQYLAKFLAWSKKFNISFDNAEEFNRRLRIFSENDAKIETHNAGNYPWKMGHNEYSHLTWEEFRIHVGLDRGVPESIKNHKTGMRPLHQVSASTPSSIDWVSKGAVTGVKNQGSCGSCWSFSATGALEGAYEIAYGSLVSLSEQQLVSCDTTDAGCDGGLMDYAFEFAQENGGLCTEDDYPYVSGSGYNPSCEYSCTVVDGTAPSSWTDVSATDSALLSAVAQQPVSVAIEADQDSFQLYSSGVFTGECGTNLDHGVLAVGYGTDSGTDYWKVKNSWGTSWGEAGYIRLERNKDQEGDQCGILLSASYPTL